MYTIIFEFKGFIISSYGLMLMIAFLLCNYLLKRYLKSFNEQEKYGDDIIFYAAIGGIVGAKMYYIIENLDNGEGYNNLVGMLNIFTSSEISKLISFTIRITPQTVILYYILFKIYNYCCWMYICFKYSRY